MNGTRNKIYLGEMNVGISKLKRGLELEFDDRLLKITYVEFILLEDDTELAEVIVN